MTKKLTKLEKYLLVNEKYYPKFRELATKYTKEVCKTIDAEYIGYYTNMLYQHIKYNDMEFQAGGFDPYFYRDSMYLSDYIKKELEDVEKTTSTRCKKVSKKV